jgi:hypothetical protein
MYRTVNKIDEISDLVGRLNDELYEQFEAVDGKTEAFMDMRDYFSLYIHTDGCNILIKFAGVWLWDWDNDLRNYIEETDEYEPLEPFLRRRINDVVSTLNHLKF